MFDILHSLDDLRQNRKIQKIVKKMLFRKKFNIFF